MVKKMGACALTVICIVCSTYNSFSVLAKDRNYINGEKEVKLEYIDGQNNYQSISYKDSSEFEKEYREDFSECKGIKIDYDNLILLDKENISEIVENGTVLIIDVETQDEVNYLSKTYQDNEFAVDAKLENLESLYLSEYCGEKIIGYIGSATSVKDTENNEQQEMDIKNISQNQDQLENVLEIIEDEENFATEVKMDELGVDYEEKSDLEFQTPSLNYAIQPVTGVCKMYTTNYEEYLGESKITIYCYKGSIWSSGGKKTYYNYIVSSVQVSPQNWLGVDEYTARIGNNNSNTSILDATYIDNNEKQSTYSLSVGVTGAKNPSVTFNGSISNTYSTSTMDVFERFSQMSTTGSAYCDWYVDPAKIVHGQSRKIEPAIVTKSTGYTYGKSSVRDVKLKKVSELFKYQIERETHTFSGCIMELKVTFK